MDGIGLHMTTENAKDMKAKFEAYLNVQEIAYLNVQEIGAYNMFDPRARDLAQEFCEEEISKADWIHMIKNYATLKEELV